MKLKLKLYWPLIAFVLPSAIIGYCYIIPGSCIAGINSYTIGYAATLVGACLTYWSGLRLGASQGDAS